MISIIVPVYNVEKYLPKCIESLINQTYRDIEIILIDDGSPDKCPQICDDFAARDNRITVIHQQNKGVSVARNVGLKVAKGEYIGFCDSDDYVDEEMFSSLYCAMEQHEAQIAVCGYDYVDENGIVTRPYVKRKTEVVVQEEIFRRYFDMPPSIRLGVWNKLFDNDLLHDITFTEGIKGAEDAEFLGKYLRKVKTAAIIHEPYYKNCERIGSATRGGLKEDSVLPALDIYMNTRLFLQKVYPALNYHAQAYYLDACLLNYGIHCQKNKEEQVNLINQLRKRVRKEFPKALFNKEIYWKTRIYYGLFALGLRR